jgi:hypothetical protein
MGSFRNTSRIQAFSKAFDLDISISCVWRLDEGGPSGVTGGDAGFNGGQVYSILPTPTQLSRESSCQGRNGSPFI